MASLDVRIKLSPPNNCGINETSHLTKEMLPEVCPSSLMFG
ncbi:hypothetical protein BRADI_1g47521v3 [Brachypodium distachyon]|uniref:Uncharacterized protein n=1 Tax=Brachypodium distachyon TaxID=15368 RepID=A0A2K2DQ17_BRADI|nr:hypothetical protein BRADI_1g47521v3 [Brachypodium distachyon]